MKYCNDIVYNKQIHGWVVDTCPNFPTYFIVGRGRTGCRFYSENMDYEDALSTMPKYIGTIEYFGGGVVELINEATNKVIKVKIVD